MNSDNEKMNIIVRELINSELYVRKKRINFIHLEAHIVEKTESDKISL